MVIYRSRKRSPTLDKLKDHEMKIGLIESFKFLSKFRRFSIKDLQILNRKIKILLTLGVVEPLRDSVCCAEFLVSKSNGQKCLVIYFRLLNIANNRDNYS